MAENAKKSNSAIKQAVIAVAVLVIICLVCVLLLALCNDLLYISDEDKFNRAMAKIYDGYGNGDAQFNSTYKLNTSISSDPSVGKINSIKKAEGKEVYIFDVQGYGGYKGAITLYVVIGPLKSGDVGIIAWTIKEHNGETLLSNIDTNWYNNRLIRDYPIAMDDYKATGATMSSTAINNAINLACSYALAKDGLGLDSNDNMEAQNAVLELLAENNYNYDKLSSPIDKSTVGTALDGETDKLTYIFVGTDANATAYAYVYGEGEERKIVVVVVTGDETKVLTSNCDDTADFYDLILAKPIREISVTSTVKLYTFVSGTETQESSVVYTVVGYKDGTYTPKNYTLKVTIANGVVTDIVITDDGWVDPEGHDEDAIEENANKLAKVLKGATLDNFDDKYEEGLVSGASQSGNIIAAAVKAALQDYAVRSANN